MTCLGNLDQFDRLECKLDASHFRIIVDLIALLCDLEEMQVIREVQLSWCMKTYSMQRMQ